MVELFISYSHRDEELRDELEYHLAALKREGVIAPWHDRRIPAGDEFDRSIDVHLERADIVLLLVSSYFLASDYCNDVEVARAMQRHEAGKARVIPVILHPCDWKRTPFAKLLATPKDGKPVSKHSNLHDAFLDVVTSIRNAAAQLSSGVGAAAKELPPMVRSAAARVAPTARSSNLRVTKKFSDHERATFRDATFEYVANYFENSLNEVCARNPELDQKFRRVDANTFTAALYRHGSEVSACGVMLGSQIGDITYSRGSHVHANSFSEWLSIQHNGQMPTLRPGGTAMRAQSEAELTQEGAAEYLWSIFIDPLQHR